MPLNWLRRKPKGLRPGAHRPQVECLEARALLSTIRTITYDQITNLPSSVQLNNGSDVLSADGNRAVFQTSGPSGDQIYTLNSDGTGLTLVDPHPNPPVSSHEILDISADGSVVLEVTGNTLRAVNADGSNLHDVITLQGYFTTRLSADGKTVFFEDSSSPTGNPQDFPAGLYSLPAAGGTPTLIASDAQVAALLGTTASNISMDPGDSIDLDVSADGQHLVCLAHFIGSDVLLGVNSDGSGLHTIGPLATANVGIAMAGISADGSTVFRYDTGDVLPAPRLTVYHFDGSGAVTLNVPDGLVADSTPPEHVQLTQDGSKLLLGSTALLINTDNSGVVQIGTDVGLGTSGVPNHSLVNALLIHPTMNSAGTEFLFATGDLNNIPQLAVAHLNPTSLGGDPAISNISINPSYILTETRSATTIKATVSASSKPAGVSEAFLLDGVSETGYFTDQQLYDDGTNRDVTAGDGIYTNNHITINYDPPTGPRTVRVSAETVDGSGLQHVTTVEVDGLTVVTQAPASNLEFSASHFNVNESAGTATVTVTRTGDSSGSVTVHYATSDGSARAGTDYTATSGDLTFAAGVTSKTISVPLLDDPDAAASESFTVTLPTRAAVPPSAARRPPPSPSRTPARSSPSDRRCRFPARPRGRRSAAPSPASPAPGRPRGSPPP
jgi:hypothetical protein